jgi:hypothetical protein
MEPDEQRAGDYGYDLVHEDVGRPRPRHGDAGDRHGSPTPIRAEDAGSGDLGYDEAHDF